MEQLNMSFDDRLSVPLSRYAVIKRALAQCINRPTRALSRGPKSLLPASQPSPSASLSLISKPTQLRLFSIITLTEMDACMVRLWL